MIMETFEETTHLTVFTLTLSTSKGVPRLSNPSYTYYEQGWPYANSGKQARRRARIRTQSGTQLRREWHKDTND